MTNNHIVTLNFCHNFWAIHKYGLKSWDNDKLPSYYKWDLVFQPGTADEINYQAKGSRAWFNSC